MFKAFVPGEGRFKGRCAVNWIFLIAGIALAGAALTWIVSYIMHAVRTGMDWAAVADDLIPNVVKTKNELSKCFVQTVQLLRCQKSHRRAKVNLTFLMHPLKCMDCLLEFFPGKCTSTCNDREPVYPMFLVKTARLHNLLFI